MVSVASSSAPPSTVALAVFSKMPRPMATATAAVASAFSGFVALDADATWDAWPMDAARLIPALDVISAAGPMVARTSCLA